MNSSSIELWNMKRGDMKSYHRHAIAVTISMVNIQCWQRNTVVHTVNKRMAFLVGDSRRIPNGFSFGVYVFFGVESD